MLVVVNVISKFLPAVPLLSIPFDFCKGLECDLTRSFIEFVDEIRSNGDGSVMNIRQCCFR